MPDQVGWSWPNFATPMVHIRSSWRSLGHLWGPWESLGFHPGGTWTSWISLAPPLGASWAPLVPLLDQLGPFWTSQVTPRLTWAPLGVLGVDGESRGSILTPKTNFKTKLMSFWNNAWINLGNVEHETLTATQPTQNSKLTPHSKYPPSSWFFEEHMLQVCACIYNKQNYNNINNHNIFGYIYIYIYTRLHPWLKATDWFREM